MSLLSSQAVLIIIGVAIVYIIFTGYLSLRWSGHSNNEFMTGNKNLPTFVVAVLLMSEFIGAMSTIGAAQTAFTSGFAAAWSILAAVVGFILYGLLFADKLYKTGGFTISHAIEQKYGKSTKIIVSIIMIYALLLVNVNNYISGASILSEILQLKLPLAMIIIGIISTFYFCIGGMKSVAYVTVIHTFLKYVGIIVVFIAALMMTKGIAPIKAALPAYYFSATGHVGLATIIGWIITITGAIFSTQFIVQAISSSRNSHEARKASFIAALLALPLGLMVAVIGICARYLFPKINNLYALTIFLRHINVWLSALVATGLLASVFIGVSAVALGIVSLIVDDFYVPHWKPTPEKQLKVTRIISLVVGFTPLVFAFATPQILALSFFTKALRVSITIVAVVAFYLPAFSDTKGANIALVGTTFISTAWFLLGDPFGISDIYVALLSPLILMFLWKMFETFTKNTGNKALHQEK
ncbi:MAG: sodium:solute symporter family protein [Liquorilactobacillus nagelii]|uniref:sodium:solute symporter family protein n=1 Tax=Liquorilactobacillus nagelii TaxID=82688 RepID=UPI0039ECA4CB